MAIQGINVINGNIAAAPVKTTTGAASAVSFKDLLLDALENVNALEQESNRITEDFIAGNTDSIHDVLIATTKASIATSFVLEVRNKVLDAYQEIMRMQI
jgi:flagellar hook-basal body complex protein FliE